MIQQPKNQYYQLSALLIAKCENQKAVTELLPKVERKKTATILRDL